MCVPRFFASALLLVCVRLVLSAALPSFLDEPVVSSPRLVQGTLENGVRYGFLRQPVPPGEVYLRLFVEAGSACEREDELGYAHFVEHMAFNGTTHYDAGSAVRYLQEQGVAFGAHFNAETSTTGTVYRLDLKAAKPELLEHSLGVLADFASGLRFDPAEVEKERGVILSEALSRQTEQQAERNEREAFFLEGTLPTRRLVIGTEKSIRHASPDRLRAFYTAWYRPERMAIAVVGDIEPAVCLALVRKQFGYLASLGPAREAPQWEAPKLATGPRIGIHRRAGQGVNLSLASVALRPTLTPEQCVWRLYFEKLQLDFARAMLAARLERLCLKTERVISDSTVMTFILHQRYDVALVGVSSSVLNAEKAAALLEQELRRALEYGFDPSELAFQVQKYKASMKDLVRSAPSAPASQLVGPVLDCLRDRQSSLLFPSEDTERYVALAEALDVEQCREALRKAFGAQAPSLFVSCPRGAKLEPSQLLEAYRKSGGTPVAKAAAIEALSFPYTDFGPPGHLLVKQELEGLGAWKLVFENGLVVFLKRTEFSRGAILAGVRVGSGRLGEPADKIGIGFLSGELILGGLGKLSMEELLLLSPTEPLSASVTPEEDALLISGECKTEHLRRELCYLSALLTDPAFRPDAHEKTQAYLNGFYNTLRQSAGAVVRSGYYRYLAGGDGRLSIPPSKDVSRFTQAEVEAWLKEQLHTGPFELALVGDFDPEQAAVYIAETLGALPRRGEPQPLARTLTLPTPGDVFKGSFSTVQPQPTTLVFSWQVRGTSDAGRRVRLVALSMVLSDRIRQAIREDKGVAYVTKAEYLSWADTYPGMAFVNASVETSESSVGRTSRQVLKIAQKLADEGPSSEELERVRAQLLAEMDSARVKNEFWFGNVLGSALRRPYRLSTALEAREAAVSMRTEDLGALAKLILPKKNAYRCEAVPVKIKR